MEHVLVIRHPARPNRLQPISVPDLRQLAGWDASQAVVKVNLDDNTEVTLAETDVVTLKPGVLETEQGWCAFAALADGAVLTHVQNIRSVTPA